MGEIKFIDSSGGNASPEFADKSFLNKDFLDQADIREIAEGIKADIGANKEKLAPARIIINALNPDSLFKRIGFSTDKEDFALIKSALNSIQRAILDELSRDIDPKKLDFVVEQLGRQNTPRTFRLQKGQILKRGFHESRSEPARSETQDEERLALLNRLYSIPHSSYIAYPLISGHLDNGELKEFQEDLNFTTLDELLRNHEATPQDGMRWIRDAMLGNLFLIEHGFAMTDNSLNNIGIFSIEGSDPPGRVGKLFDMDGLLSLGKVITSEDSYFSRQDYTPPEADESVFTVAEPQMVYELGKCLYKLLTQTASSRATWEKVGGLASKMCKERPSERISLAIAITELERILSPDASETNT